MNNIFEQLFQYGFHDTEITSIEGNDLDIKLNFNNGIYLLDKNGKETNLTKPIQLVLKLDSYFNDFEESIEIKEYGRKIRYLDYLTFKTNLQKESFGIAMVYYSNFNNCILFDGGFSKKNIMLSFECINEIIIQELK